VKACESDCGENSNEPICSVKDKELNELLYTCRHLMKDFSL